MLDAKTFLAYIGYWLCKRKWFSLGTAAALDFRLIKTWLPQLIILQHIFSLALERIIFQKKGKKWKKRSSTHLNYIEITMKLSSHNKLNILDFPPARPQRRLISHVTSVDRALFTLLDHAQPRAQKRLDTRIKKRKKLKPNTTGLRR